MSRTVIWTCPVCRESLALSGRSYRCTKGHTYDLAAKGYVNLLLANQRKSKDPGDNKEMLVARAHILQAGYFDKLAHALTEQIVLGLQDREKVNGAYTILDAGCGEGYYLNYIKEGFEAKDLDVDCYGLDISKSAVTMASSYEGISLAVASSKLLPVATASVDCILQIFAPHSNQEFSRVLRADGRLLTVTPGREHLYGLKQLLYTNPYYNEEEEHPYPSFQIIEKQRIRVDLELTEPTLIEDLVKMTPYYWRTDPAKLAELRNLKELCTPLEFIVTNYKRV